MNEEKMSPKRKSKGKIAALLAGLFIIICACLVNRMAKEFPIDRKEESTKKAEALRPVSASTVPDNNSDERSEEPVVLTALSDSETLSDIGVGISEEDVSENTDAEGEEDSLVYRTTGSYNIRQDINGAVIKTLGKDTVCYGTGKTDPENKWVEVILEDGTTGWVFGQGLMPAEGQAEPVVETVQAEGGEPAEGEIIDLPEEVSLPTHDATTAERRAYYYITDAVELIWDGASSIGGWAYMDQNGSNFNSEYLYLTDPRYGVNSENPGDVFDYIMADTPMDETTKTILAMAVTENEELKTADMLLQKAQEEIEILGQGHSLYSPLMNYYSQTKEFYDFCKVLYQSYANFSNEVENYLKTIEETACDTAYQIAYYEALNYYGQW